MSVDSKSTSFFMLAEEYFHQGSMSVFLMLSEWWSDYDTITIWNEKVMVLLSLIIHSTSSSTVGGLVIGRSAHSAYPVLGISYLKLHLGKVGSDTLRVLNVTRMRLSWFSVERYSFLGVNILFFFSVDHDKQSSHGLLSWYYSYLTISGQTCLVDKNSHNP